MINFANLEYINKSHFFKSTSWQSPTVKSSPLEKHLLKILQIEVSQVMGYQLIQVMDDHDLVLKHIATLWVLHIETYGFSASLRLHLHGNQRPRDDLLICTEPNLDPRPKPPTMNKSYVKCYYVFVFRRILGLLMICSTK